MFYTIQLYYILHHYIMLYHIGPRPTRLVWLAAVGPGAWPARLHCGPGRFIIIEVELTNMTINL